MKKILFLSANPHATSRLRLDEELREVRDCLHHSENRKQYELEPQTALRVKDLRRTGCEPKCGIG